MMDTKVYATTPRINMTITSESKARPLSREVILWITFFIQVAGDKPLSSAEYWYLLLPGKK